MTNERDASEALEQLGLTEYEARCFVGLSQLGRGTAKEISKVANVPRSRVYDTVGKLHEMGIVDVQESDPREFRAVSVDDALETLREDYAARIDIARDQMEEVETTETLEEEGVWEVASHDHVTDRLLSTFEEASEKIHYLVAYEDAIEKETLDALAEATGRGVSVLVEVADEEGADRISDAVPKAEVGISDILAELKSVEGKLPGRLTMVDQRAIVATGVEEDHLPGVFEETAIWTDGRDHGFATWIHQRLAGRLDGES